MRKIDSRFILTVTVLVVAAFMAGRVSAVGQQTGRGRTTPPAATEGNKNDWLVSMDLGPEFECMKGRELRLGMTTWQPGGATVQHSHEGRPAVARMMQGAMVEHRADGTMKEIKAGETWSEGKDVTHWVENRGTVPAAWILAIVAPPAAPSTPPR